MIAGQSGPALDFVTLADGRPAIVMELILGQTLREIVRAGPVPIATRCC